MERKREVGVLVFWCFGVFGVLEGHQEWVDGVWKKGGF